MPPTDPGTDPGTDPIGNNWDSNAVYNTGDRVVVNGVTYEAKWWTQGDNPETSGTSGPWKKNLSPVDSNKPPFLKVALLLSTGHTSDI